MSPPAASLAAALVGVSVLLLLPPSPAGGGVGRAAVAARRAPGHLVPPAVVVTAALLWVLLPGRAAALALVAAGTGLSLAGLGRRRRRAREADRRAEHVLGVCEMIASDLRAGQPPAACLARAAREWPELAPAAAAASMGADVPTELRRLATRPGGRDLRVLAASWQVAHHTGAGLAGSVARTAEAIRASRRTTRLVATELAAARATARTLAVLPVGVLLLGAGVGGDPVGFLLGSTPGLVCLAAGLALSLAGLSWLEAIGDRVLGRESS